MFAGVEALKELEDALEILRLDTDAIVPDREDPALRVPADADMDLGGLLATELNCVADQVLEQLRHLGGIHSQTRQRVVGHLGLGRFEAGLQVAEGIADERVQVRRDEVAALGADPREGQ
jgi:hypothetical protein